jgi:hypothetical protein
LAHVQPIDEILTCHQSNILEPVSPIIEEQLGFLFSGIPYQIRVIVMRTLSSYSIYWGRKYGILSFSVQWIPSFENKIEGLSYQASRDFP